MILQFTASADTYITNKIINNTFSASDANVGRAGTIDIYKLYDESTLTGSANEPYSTDKIELSRALIKFDYSTIQALTRSKLDYTNSSFRAELLLYDVMGGQGVPADFTLSVFPLARKFDEGNGRDVAGFRDLDVSNWKTSSYSEGTSTLWVSGGAAASGSSDGPELVDYFASGNVNGSITNLNFECKQTFVEGTEDLAIDVTKLVSASLAGQITNHGFRLSFTGSQEDDSKTRFVKRFGSAQARNIFLKPKLRIGFDDSIQDHHTSFYFDLTGSIFLNSFERGRPASIKSGTLLTPITGSSISPICLNVNLVTGAFSKTIPASQHKIPGDINNFITGVYSSTFALDINDNSVISGTTTISDYVRDSGSITFDTYWQSLDGLTSWHTGSLKINSPIRFGFNEIPKDLGVKITNLSPEFKTNEKVKLRIFITDYNKETIASRRHYFLKSTTVETAYYQVRDVITGKIVIPFIQTATRLSEDSNGMYFEFDMSSLHKGRTYTFDIKTVDTGEIKIHKTLSRFRVI